METHDIITIVVAPHPENLDLERPLAVLMMLMFCFSITFKKFPGNIYLNPFTPLTTIYHIIYIKFVNKLCRYREMKFQQIT